MEQCLDNQQAASLLLYLDNIFILSPDVRAMLELIELVFSWMKAFNLKIKQKKCYFFQTSMIFLGHVLSADGISANPEKVEKVRNWLVLKITKELHSFLGLVQQM